MQRANEYHVAIWMGLDDKKALEKTEGLRSIGLVRTVTIFRVKSIPGLPRKFVQKTPPHVLDSWKLGGHLWIAFATVIYALTCKPNLCVGISLYPHTLFARVAALLSRSKFGVWFIGTDLYYRLNRRLAAKALVPVLRRAAVAMTMGESSSRHLVRLGWNPSRVMVGRNAYRLDRYEPSATKEYEWDLIFTGRFDREPKGLDLLVETIEKSTKHLPLLRCVLVGDGPDRGWLEAYMKRYGLQGNILIPGYVKDVSGYLNRSRLLLMTSRWEGLPSSIVEALSCGVPVISTDVGDVSGICKHRSNSLLAKSKSSDELSGLVIQALSNAELMQSLQDGATETGRELRKDPVGKSARAWEKAIRAALT